MSPACRPLPRLLTARAGRLSRSHGSASTLSSSGFTNDLFDLVCVGGGPAGLSLIAGILASPAANGLKIALVEGQDLSRLRDPKDGPDAYSNRCSSLTPASLAHLRDIGAWQFVDKNRVQPYSEMEVWDGATDARITFNQGMPQQSIIPTTPRKGSRDIAYMIENSNIIQALLTRLENLSSSTSNHLDLFSATKVESIEMPSHETTSASPSGDPKTKELEPLDLSSWPKILLSNGRAIRARLLVGADGPSSPVRSFAGIPSRGWDYERHGLVATVRLQPPQSDSNFSGTAYQRFLPTGPIALLPLPDNHASLVWSTTPKRAAHLRRISEEDFAATIDAGFRLLPADLDYFHSIASGQRDELSWRLDHTNCDAARVPPSVATVQEGSRAVFPLKMRHADTYIGERVALVGDAAHTIHPLAGQGLNQGQGDAASLSRVITSALETGQDIGSTLALEPYVSERYVTNNAMIGVCDKLHKLYSVEGGPLVGLRSVGLNALDKWGWGKDVLMRVASGQQGIL